MAKILIIGGGAAGLCAGIRARLEGHEALILEKEKTPGGCLNSWEREGFHIDNCIHWLTGTNPKSESYKLWEEAGALGAGIPVIGAESLYTSERDGESLSLWRDLEKTEREMLLLSPGDEKEIRRFFGAVRALQGVCGIGGKGHDEKITPKEALRAAPGLFSAWRETTGEMAKRFSHPLIRRFFTDLLTEDFSALALLLVFCHFTAENGGIPAGGSDAMAKRMLRRFLSLGGRVESGFEVVRVREGKREVTAQSAGGERRKADFAVLTLDPAVAFPVLLKEKLPPFFEKRLASPKRARFSACHAAFGVSLPSLPFRGDLVLHRGENRRLILREFSHEPSFSPEGRCLLQAMEFCDEKRARYFLQLKKDPAAYRAEKDAFAREAARAVEKRFPSLTGKLKLLDVWTPASYKRYLGTETGSFMGFAFAGGVLPKKAPCRIPGHKRLVLAGQWIEEPGGLPIAAESGRRAALFITRLAEKNERKNKAVSPFPVQPEASS